MIKLFSFNQFCRLMRQAANLGPAKRPAQSSIGAWPCAGCLYTQTAAASAHTHCFGPPC